MEKLIGKRFLTAKKSGYSSDLKIEEVKLLEISPSGQYVKLMDVHGKKYWTPYNLITPIEILADKEKCPTKI